MFDEQNKTNLEDSLDEQTVLITSNELTNTSESDNNSDTDSDKYDVFMERLKIAIAEFFRYAEAGKTIRYQALKARKKSIDIRNLLKQFRVVSLRQEKKISKVFEEAKKKLNNQT
jgi:hypothetical protein